MTDGQARTGRVEMWVAGVCLVLATAFAYHAVWDYPYIDYDDPGYVFANEHVRRGLTGEGLRWALTTGQQSNWHPLTWWSHMLDVQLFGVERPGAMHLVNVAFHTANALLLWLLLLRATGSRRRSALVAAIFALHPLHVESVAWISERKDVLSTLFGLLSMLAYVAYTRRGRLRWYVTAFFLLALGLLAKPMLVTLPFLFLLLDYWPLERDVGDGGDGGDAGLPWVRLVSEKLPLFMLVALSAWVTFGVQQQGGAVVFDQSLDHRLSTSVVGYALYLDKLIRPVNLALLYPNHEGMWQAWQVLGAVALLIALTAAFVALAGGARRGRRRYPLMGWLWFLGTLVPVIGLVQFGRQVIADRYMYLPMVGLLIVAVWGAWDLLARRPGGGRVGAAAAAVVLTGCLWLTPRQVALWRDSSTLFGHALAVTERNDPMHHALAHVLQAHGELEQALEHYRAGLAINPHNPQGFYNYAGVLKLTGRNEEAIAEYRRALALDPDYRDAHTNLAGALAALGRADEALFHYRQALRLDRGYKLGHYNLAGALIAAGHVAEGVRHYREALLIDPDFVEAHNNLALTLARGGDLDGAARHFREVLRLRPDDAAARRNLARTQTLRGRQ